MLQQKAKSKKKGGEYLETIEQNPNGNSRVSIITNNSIDRSIQITKLKKMRKRDLRKMKFQRLVEQHKVVEPMYITAVLEGEEMREKLPKCKNNVKAS